MRVFSLSEALVYLNTILPGIAPKNEVTLRRAIRNNELKAEVSQGRAGTKIREDDLLEFSKKYNTFSKAPSEMRENNLINVLMKDTAGIPKLVDIMKVFKDRIENDSFNYKIKLLETKGMWEEKRSELQKNINQLENELQKCLSEINAFDSEINKI